MKWFFSRSHLTSTSTNYMLFPDNPVLFPLRSTHRTHHTCKLSLPLRITGFSLEFKPCAHSWFRYKRDAKGCADQTHLRIRHIWEKDSWAHTSQTSKSEAAVVRFWYTDSLSSLDPETYGSKVSHMKKTPHRIITSRSFCWRRRMLAHTRFSINIC